MFLKIGRDLLVVENMLVRLRCKNREHRGLGVKRSRSRFFFGLFSPGELPPVRLTVAPMRHAGMGALCWPPRSLTGGARVSVGANGIKRGLLFQTSPVVDRTRDLGRAEGWLH